MLDATRPTSRVLAMLELLQDRPGITGPVLASELGVTTRTIRRYVVTLQDMGIPVEPAAGRTGGYWLRPGFRMPPLMFSAEEAIGLAVALLNTRTSNTAALPTPVANALGKIERVLPRELASQIATIRDGFRMAENPWPEMDAFPDPMVLATLIQGSLTHQRCWIRYGRPDGDQTDQTAREVEPYGVLAYYGRWYMHGWCHLRKGTRTFRVDRVRRIDLLPERFEPPAGFDIQEAVTRSLALTRTGWDVEIIVDAAAADVARFIMPPTALLEARTDGRTRLYCTTDNLDWFAWRISELPFPMTIIHPEELRTTLNTLGQRLLAIDGEVPQLAATAR
ncbi:MAG: YafY family transcriptional regulator [Chloroflexia bacterium]|nr:YafY family transcriptional regulator [Chloroflexia bacterium]